MREYKFKEAEPVWKVGCEYERNMTLEFVSKLNNIDSAVICLAASSVYRIFVNDIFVAAGPARAGHGYYRVDEIDITKYLEKENTVTVFVTGYNTDTFSIPNQSSFLCAEIKDGENVIAATGNEGFVAREYCEKIQKVQRYSYQRAYAEYYRIADNFSKEYLCTIQRTDNKKFITRDVYYPEYDKIAITKQINKGVIHYGENIRPYDDRSLTEIYTEADGFLREELEFEATKEIADLSFVPKEEIVNIINKFTVNESEFQTFELDFNDTGFIDFNVRVSRATRLIVTFDEILDDQGDINYIRNNTANVIVYDLTDGIYHLSSAEPYTFKYIRIASIGGVTEVENFSLIEYKFPKVSAECILNDDRDIKIFDAALESFYQSALDIYMDCPSRERAGWLCDSFFMGRVEYALTGKSVVEKNFLENFLMYKYIKNIPDGMIPMLYPADFRTELFIPNWAMWFVIELEDYKNRTNDTEIIAAAKERVYALVKYFKKFENSCGLLERLENWVFIEWSKSNDYTMDVNFPTNMLYYKMKLAIFNMYNDLEMLGEADKLKETIISMSYRNGFFHDRALLKDNELYVTDEITETAQYYAFFTGVADTETFETLWNTLQKEFGPQRGENIYPHIAPSNAFIGNYLRLDLIRKYGNAEQLVDETRGYFLYMAEKTGTLWEDVRNIDSSLCHGFASYVLLWYLK